MSDWRAELCRRSYAGFGKLDAGEVLPVYHPACVWELAEVGLAFGTSTLIGHDGVRTLIDGLASVYPDYSPVIDELRSREDGALLVRFHAAGTGERSDVPVEIAGGQVMEFEEGLISRVTQTGFPPPGWDEATPIS